VCRPVERSVSDVYSQTLDRDQEVAANCASLLGLSGITASDVHLLEAVGVDTLRELRRCVPENLYARIMEAARRHHVETLPRLDEVTGWVAYTKRICR